MGSLSYMLAMLISKIECLIYHHSARPHYNKPNEKEVHNERCKTNNGTTRITCL